MATALAAEIEASGTRVHCLPAGAPLEETLAALDAIWRAGPAPHLFLLTVSNSESLDPRDGAAWQRRTPAGIEMPYFVCQRWVQLAREAGMLDRSTLVATTSLGGDFGFAGEVPSFEGGWLTGLMKSLFIEIVRVGNHRDLIVKAIDAPPDEPPELLAAGICRELAARTDDFEVAFVNGRRYLQNAQPLPALPLPLGEGRGEGVESQAVSDPHPNPLPEGEGTSANIRHGGVWVATGGARGITAACAMELGRRFGLRLHLIGASPQPDVDPAWLEMKGDELSQLKTSIMRAAYERGEQPPAAWSRVEKAIEIARSLRTFAAAGVAATYHTCDVADRAALERVLADVRRQDGPIDGLLHGAGIDIPRRFEKKERAAVMATFAAKVQGAANLIALTQDDPLTHFIGFGSVSGRLGSNGQTDYAAASDMLCKLAAWLARRRPACRAIGFHWAPWDEVGIAARPENRVALKVKDAPKLMPKREGVEHLLRELYTDNPRSEVLIIDPAYYKLFYDKDEPPPVGPDDPPDAQVQDSPLATHHSPLTSAPLASAALTDRFVLRLFETPAPDAGSLPNVAGPIYVLGDNAVAQALSDQLAAEGQAVVALPVADSPEAAIERLEAAWREQPGNYLVLTTACDDEAAHIFEPRAWQGRLCRGVLTPYLVLQRWRQLFLAWRERRPATVAAITRLGGDFGLGGNCTRPEGGAVAGMLKSLSVEDVRSGDGELRIRVIDTRQDEAPQDVASWTLRELAHDSGEVEVSWQAGRRFALRPVVVGQAASLPGNSATSRLLVATGTGRLPVATVPHGTWIITGGACGISAETALALGRRYGLSLHLIGRSPPPDANAAWRNLSPPELEAYKEKVVREAIAQGRSSRQAWERIRKDVEIHANLQRFAAAGVQATYHACDVGDLADLAAVLDEVRRADGPITGVLHGAGTNNPARLERQRREVVEPMIAAKVAGAWNLMFLTRQDPVRHFLGFGSITGRFGGNGMTDYAATNDMLARLVGWYRRQRPDCLAVCFDWESWAGVGMAVAPRHAVGGARAGLQFMPPAEGIEHILRELAAGAPEAEVLFTRDSFIAERYPHVRAEKLTDSGPMNLPLIRGFERPDGRTIATVMLDPVAQPFLREHRLRGRPILPAVVGMELLAEAALAAAGGGQTVVALRDMQISDGLVFHSDQPLTAQVGVDQQSPAQLAARLTCDFYSRSGKLIQAARPYLHGVVEFASQRPRLIAACPPPPEAGWRGFHYEDNHVMYHGHVLRGVVQTTFNDREGWARLVALPLQGLAGIVAGTLRVPTTLNWIIPSTLLDSAFYACGIHVWYFAGGAVSLPRALRELRLGRPMRDHERCLVHFVCRRLDAEAAEYDFTILGEDGEPILEALGYRKVLLKPPGGAA